MCRECCRSASSRPPPPPLGLTERGRGAAASPSFSVRGGGRRVGDDTAAGDRAAVAPAATCRRWKGRRSKPHALPPMLLLLAAAVVVTETATIGERNLYSTQEGGNFAPQPPALSLEPQRVLSAAATRSPPVSAPSAPATGLSEQRAGGRRADAVDLWPSYESPAEHLVDSAKRNRRQLVEQCAIKISGSGYFMTPQYPQLVTDGAYTCFWQLSVVYAGQTVSLDLSDLQTSRSSGGGGQPDDCGDSYVAVADLRGHVVRYCSPQPLPVLVGENVYVWASGHARDSFGLRASFRSTFSAPDWNPTPPVCGGRLQEGDTFATPRYPSAYPKTRTCFWAAAAAAGRRLTLVFDSFDVGHDATCESDYVTVWTSDRGLIPRLCGNVIPANVSTAAYIFVFFSSDSADDGGAIGFRARFLTDEAGVGQPTLGVATSVQPWSTAEPPATSTIASPVPTSSSQTTEPTGGVSDSGSSRAASTETSTNAGGSSSPLAWGTTPPADGQNNRTTLPTVATSTSTFANVNGTGESTEPPLPSASSSSYVSEMTTATRDRHSSTTAAEAATTSPRPASSPVTGIGSRSTVGSSRDSAPETSSSTIVQPEPEFSSSTPPPPATTLEPGGGTTVRPSDVPSSSMTPLPTASATPEQQSVSTVQLPLPRTVQPTPDASAASGPASTTLPSTTATLRRCKSRQKLAADVSSRSTKLALPPP